MTRLKYLLCFAHPDDEAVGAGGTVKRLTDLGHEVRLVVATAGEAGRVAPGIQKGSEKQKSVASWRREELAKSCEILGIKKSRCLGFPDGKIGDRDIRNRLFKKIAGEIEEYQPDFVITFDHTGWGFHLDHIAVSLATCLAFERAKYRPKVLLFVLFRTAGLAKKYPWVFPRRLPATHRVDIGSVATVKISALQAHVSQQFSFLAELEKGRMDKEYFQLVKAGLEGRKMVSESGVFEPIT